MRLLFATSSADKLREAREILGPLGLEIGWRRRRLPELQADTLKEVVAAKLAAAPRTRPPVLVEDSGLFVAALNGFPGVYARQALETIGLQGILRLLKGRGRQARFATVAGIRWRGRTWFSEGTIAGRIADAPRGQGGFGYDPIFIPVGERRTFAELGAEGKHAYSHRARALRAVVRPLFATGRKGR
jgi:XTP/dITP diphosphohydrolase